MLIYISLAVLRRCRCCCCCRHRCRRAIVRLDGWLASLVRVWHMNTHEKKYLSTTSFCCIVGYYSLVGLYKSCRILYDYHCTYVAFLYKKYISLFRMNCSEKFQFNFYFGAFFVCFACMEYVYHLLHDYNSVYVVNIILCVMLMLNKNIADKIFFRGKRIFFTITLKKCFYY